MTDLVPGPRESGVRVLGGFGHPPSSTLRRRRRRNRRAGGSARREPSELRPSSPCPRERTRRSPLLPPRTRQAPPAPRPGPAGSRAAVRRRAVGDRRRVATGWRPHACRHGRRRGARRSISGEPRRRRWPARGRPAGPVGQIEVGLFEVVAEDLLELEVPVPGAVDGSAHPTNRSWSEARVRFRRPLVRGVPDQNVVEAERGPIVVGRVRLGSAALRSGRRAVPARSDGTVRPTISVTADSGNCSPITEAGSMTARSSRPSRSRRDFQQAPGSWPGPGRPRPVVDDPPSPRDAGRRPRSASRAAAPHRAGCPRPRTRSAAHPGGSSAPPRRFPTIGPNCGSPAARARSDRLPPDRPSPAAVAAKSCRAVHSSRMARRTHPSRLREQVQERRFGPVDVVDDHDRGARRPGAPGTCAAQNISGSGNWAASGRRSTRRVRRVLGVPDASGEPGPGRFRQIVFPDARRRANDLDERPERDAVAVRQAPPADTRPGVGRSHELANEPRLADAGVPDDGGQPNDAIVASALKSPRAGASHPAADHRRSSRRARPSSCRRRASVDRRAPLGLALERRAARSSSRTASPDQPIRQFADEDLVIRGRLLESCRRR